MAQKYCPSPTAAGKEYSHQSLGPAQHRTIGRESKHVSDICEEIRYRNKENNFVEPLVANVNNSYAHSDHG